MMKSTPVVLTDCIPAHASKNILLVLGGVVFISILSHIRVYLPHSPVPHTGQSIGVILIGLTYGRNKAFLTTLLYLMVRPFIGLPLELTSSGYLAGMLLASLALGWMSENGWGRKFSQVIMQVFIAKLLIFGCGVIVLGSIIGFEKALYVGVVPFIPTMILKALLCAWMVPVAWKVVKN